MDLSRIYSMQELQMTTLFGKVLAYPSFPTGDKKASQLYQTANKKIKSSLYLRYDTEACNEWRSPSPPLSAWATQLGRNVAALATLCLI